jgi:hypothetical protein
MQRQLGLPLDMRDQGVRREITDGVLGLLAPRVSPRKYTPSDNLVTFAFLLLIRDINSLENRAKRYLCSHTDLLLAMLGYAVPLLLDRSDGEAAQRQREFLLHRCQDYTARAQQKPQPYGSIRRSCSYRIPAALRSMFRDAARRNHVSMVSLLVAALRTMDETQATPTPEQPVYSLPGYTWSISGTTVTGSSFLPNPKSI